MEQEKDNAKSFSSMLEDKKQGFKSLKKDTRVAIYVGASGLVFATVLGTGYAMKNKYDVLFTGLDDIDAGNIVKQLESENVDVKIEGSTIYVPKKQVDRLRLELSSTITNGSQGFELMDKSSSFGMTDEEFKLKKQRMIQGEIEKTIKTFPQVESARVHINQGEESVFAKDATPGSSAVYINLKPGRSLTEAQVASIISLVSASSYNIPKPNVEVIDQNMNLLSEGMFDENGMYSGKSLSELDTARKAEKEYNEDLKSAIKELLEPIFGVGKVKVSVNTDLNFDTEDKKVLIVDPNRVAIKEYKSENSTTDSVSSGSPVDNNMSSQGNGNGKSNKSLESNVDYTTGQSETITSVAKGNIRSVSTSVVIDGIQDEQTLAMVEQMVQTAVGYNANRGDKVSVVSMQFSNELEEAQQALLEKEKKEALIKTAVTIGGTLGAILLVALIISIINKKKKKAMEESGLNNLDSMTNDEIISSAIAEVEGVVNSLKEESRFSEDDKSQSLDDEIKDFATKNPEQMVELLKIWLNE